VKRALVVAAVLFGSVAAAQEIGSEIPVAQPGGQGGQGGFVPAGPPPDKSMKPFAFGLRASFSGSTSLSYPAGTGSSGQVVPTLGVRLLVANAVAINIDAGLALGIQPLSYNAIVGFTVGAGVDIRFREVKDALRPYIAIQATFAKGFSGYYGDLSLGAAAGGGAEYFFDPHFSMSVRGMIGIQVDLNPVAPTLVLATFTPGVLATVYF
jgi:hypothetical protein